MSIALVNFNHSDASGLTTWPDLRTSRWKPNYGDMLVCASIIRQLDSEDTVRVGFGGTPNHKLDRALIRGSTYLHNEFDFAAANKTLDSIDAPVAVVGLGAQSPTQDPTYLDDNEGARGFIARLSEKGASLSVRGNFTAEVVERLGAKDIRVTGCPSLFFTGSAPEVRLPEMLSRPERSVGVSLHTGLSQSIFCREPAKTRQMHGRVIAHLIRNAASVSLFEQGAIAEYDVADRELPFAERVDAARGILKTIGGAEFLTEYDLVARMVSVRSIEEWLSKARDLDAIVGFRFHGNMVALLQGRPCFYYTYDSRLKEFCDLYSLPYRDVADDWVSPVEAMHEHDWQRANQRMRMCLRELKAFYQENELPTRLS